MIIEADGRSQMVHTQHRRVAEVLAEGAGIGVRPQDEALINGQVWTLDEDLPPPPPSGEIRQGPEPRRPDPVRIVLRRAVPVHLSDDGVPVTFQTTQGTVGEALLSQGILLYLGIVYLPAWVAAFCRVCAFF